MSPNNSESNPKNPQLYNYIQRAYEYVKSISDDRVAGNRDEFIKRLYRQRFRSIFDRDFPETGNFRESVADWIKDVRDQQDNIIQGRITDLFIDNYEEDQFVRNANRFFRGFDEDKHEIDYLGVEAYATYLPIHFFFSGEQYDTDWGIYISEKGVTHLAGQLLSYSRDYIDLKPEREDLFVEMAYQILLRHELEHYKIEAFTLNAEMMLGKPLYSPYLIDIYTESYQNNECLEEGLANATVLHSRKIKSIFENEIYPNLKDDLPKNIWQEIIIKAFFNYQPPSYRNYYLHDGPHMAIEAAGNSHRRLAMNYLCNQIISGTIRPSNDIPLYAFPPDNYFLRAEHLVPIHIVKSLDEEDSFLYMATPSCREFEKFIKNRGYFRTDRGKGSHTVWSGPKADITVSCDGKHVGFRSYKTSLQTLGITPNEYIRMRR